MQAELFSRPAPAVTLPDRPMTALSLLQPWLWAILEAGKRLENRNRRDGLRPLVMLHRGELWLHASKGESRPYWEGSIFDMVAARLVDPDQVPPRERMPRGCIVGRCNVVGYVSPQRVPKTARNGRECLEMVKHFDGPRMGAALAADLSSPAWHRQQLAWWGEGYALILADVQKLVAPIPCKGAQGPWQIPGDVAAQLAGAELLPCAA